MKYKLIALDLDGTLKNSENKNANVLIYIPTSTEAEGLFSLFEKSCNCLSK